MVDYDVQVVKGQMTTSFIRMRDEHDHYHEDSYLYECLTDFCVLIWTVKFLDSHGRCRRTLVVRVGNNYRIRYLGIRDDLVAVQRLVGFLECLPMSVRSTPFCLSINENVPKAYW